jgi:hypothetical protein
VVTDPNSDIANVFVGIYIVDLAGAAKRLQNGKIVARFLMADEQKVLSSKSDNA